jgi:hypothetical protein
MYTDQEGVTEAKPEDLRSKNTDSAVITESEGEKDVRQQSGTRYRVGHGQMRGGRAHPNVGRTQLAASQIVALPLNCSEGGQEQKRLSVGWPPANCREGDGRKTYIGVKALILRDWTDEES